MSAIDAISEGRSVRKTDLIVQVSNKKTIEKTSTLQEMTRKEGDLHRKQIVAKLIVIWFNWMRNISTSLLYLYTTKAYVKMRKQ